jgi:hypothetical protein
MLSPGAFAIQFFLVLENVTNWRLVRIAVADSIGASKIQPTFN